MAMSRKLVLTALCTALILLLSAKVFAKSDEIKVRSVEMTFETMTVRVNQERTLLTEIYPKNAADKTLVWSSSNEEIAMVDGEGVVTGISPGQVEIIATSHNGRRGVCLVTVPGTVLTEIELQTSNEENTAAQIQGGERLSAQTLRLDVEKAVNSTPKYTTAVITYTDKTVVSTTALRSASFAAEYQQGDVQLQFKTKDNEQRTVGQITIDPKQAGNEDRDIQLALQVNGTQTTELKENAQSRFPGDIYVIQLSHDGAFGMDISVAANLALPADAVNSVVLYQYSGSDFTLLENPQTKMDGNGFLHFTTNQGGTVVAVIQ